MNDLTNDLIQVEDILPLAIQWVQAIWLGREMGVERKFLTWYRTLLSIIMK